MENQKLEFRVAEKGGCSVYGLQKFPVTLYKDQWARLLGAKDELEQFLKEHETELRTKAKP